MALLVLLLALIDHSAVAPSAFTLQFRCQRTLQLIPQYLSRLSIPPATLHPPVSHPSPPPPAEIFCFLPSLPSFALDSCGGCTGRSLFHSHPKHIHMSLAVAAHAYLLLLAAQTGGIERKPKTNPIRRILGRIGSQIDVFSGTSGDESDTRQVSARGRNR